MATCKMQETTQESTFSKDKSRIARGGVPFTRLVSPPVIQAGKHSICNCCACSGRKQRDGKELHCSFTRHKYKQMITLSFPVRSGRSLLSQCTMRGTSGANESYLCYLVRRMVPWLMVMLAGSSPRLEATSEGRL